LVIERSPAPIGTDQKVILPGLFGGRRVWAQIPTLPLDNQRRTVGFVGIFLGKFLTSGASTGK
jgi:hypothetical protein